MTKYLQFSLDAQTYGEFWVVAEKLGANKVDTLKRLIALGLELYD